MPDQPGDPPKPPRKKRPPAVPATPPQAGAPAPAEAEELQPPEGVAGEGGMPEGGIPEGAAPEEVPASTEAEAAGAGDVVMAGGEASPPENGKPRAVAAAGNGNGSRKGANGMPQYLSPGVYVEEIPSAEKPIAGVGTSIAGFIGIYTGPVKVVVPNLEFDPTQSTEPGKEPGEGKNLPYRVENFPPTDEDVKKLDDAATEAEGKSKANPADRTLRAAAARASDVALAARAVQIRATKPGVPKLCTNFGDFEKFFGSFSASPAHNRLAHGVYGFFNNGGTRCWVVRFDADGDLNFKRFEAIDEIALVAAPGITTKAVQQAVVDHCANMKDRFAVLDGNDLGPDADATEDAIRTVDYANFAALYFPYLRVFDVAKKRMDPASDGLISVAPSGHIAGIYARVDNTRGVHKAPANEGFRGVLGVTYPVSRAIQDGLNPRGINCIRDINGAIRVWGARTLGGDMNMDYRYINVRRLMLFLEESIDEGTQWVVFEPNDRSLWAKISRNITAFLLNVWHSGALFGSTPAEAFYVKCDDETNPPEVREQGKVVTEIGVAVVKPAEFVIFHITQKRQDVK